MLRCNSCEWKSSSPCERPKVNKIFDKNEERRDTCISITPNPIQSDSNRQFTKLAKPKSRAKDIQTDNVIQAHPDERTHLTNTKVTSSNINEMSHVMNMENQPTHKERDRPPPPSQNLTTSQNPNHHCSSLGIA